MGKHHEVPLPPAEQAEKALKDAAVAWRRKWITMRGNRRLSYSEDDAREAEKLEGVLLNRAAEYAEYVIGILK